jgi:hypothetical protein
MRKTQVQSSHWTGDFMSQKWRIYGLSDTEPLPCSFHNIPIIEGTASALMRGTGAVSKQVYGPGCVLLAFVEGHEVFVCWAGVVGFGANQAIVAGLLQDVGGPSDDTADGEGRGEEVAW